jgi:hypothetical protein
MICSNMSDAATALPETDSVDGPAGGEDGAAGSRQLRMLDRLADAGLEIALVIERRVKAAEAAEPLAQLTAAAQAYDRVARAVRLTLLLRQELLERREEQDGPPGELRRRQAHRDRVVAVVRRVARDHCRLDPFAVSAYAKEAAERLDTDDIYGMVASRPVGELVARLCRDFGLEPNWDALAEEAWAQAEMDSGAEGSPFAGAGTCSAASRTCPSKRGRAPSEHAPAGHPIPP